MEEDKKAEIIKKFQFEVGKEAMALFYALELKDGMKSLIINDANGDEFSFSFNKVNNCVLDDVIVSHLKALTKKIEDSHCYGFEDVLNEYLDSL